LDEHILVFVQDVFFFSQQTVKLPGDSDGFNKAKEVVACWKTKKLN